MTADVGGRPVAVGNPDGEGKTCIVEIVCTGVLGDRFLCDALSKPVRLMGQYKDRV